MNILITGASGQLGQAVKMRFDIDGHNVVALGSLDLDITNDVAVDALVQAHQPDVIINCAAYTAVDLAETEISKAHLVNAIGPANLARAAERIGAILIHISTDYVFNGESVHPYVETDLAVPINVYGQTKLAGEISVLEICSRSYILRTSWLYDTTNSNFLTTMLNLARVRETISVVDDQIGQPTTTFAVANAIFELCLKLPPFGIYNLTCSGSTSWFGFAREIFKVATLDPMRILSISTVDFPRPARRPMYSVLSNIKWTNAGMTPLNDWAQELASHSVDIFQFSESVYVE